MQQIEIQPGGPVDASIRPPGSKSITNRALICAALASGKSYLTGVLDSDDTRVMIESLSRLGVSLSYQPAATELEIVGTGGEFRADQAKLFIGNSGTSVRFLTALATLGYGRVRIDGTPRMHQRPIADLLDALRQLGARATSENCNGCPPVVVHGSGISGGTACIRGDISSQFLSALLMVAPYARSDVAVMVDGALVSQPYVQMTLKVMETFGVDVRAGDLTRFDISSETRYQPTRCVVEPDASAASYFWGAAAITQSRILVQGLSRNSLQGDVGFCDCLSQMGCLVEDESEGIAVTGRPLRGIEVNMNAISDTVQTLAAVALFAEGSTTIRGVDHIRHKETDRIGDLASELRKLGAQIDEFDDGLRIAGGGLHGASIDTYDDHRMAMSLALVGLVTKGIVINDPSCTAKTYPRYFNDLETLFGTKFTRLRE